MRLFPTCCLIGLLPCEVALSQNAVPPPADAAKTIVSPQAPSAKSPIESFRDLLNLDPAARQKVLASKTPAYRQSLEAKLKEYLDLPPTERELRLKLVELRWYLSPLMRMRPAQRAASLAMIPEADRPLIVERLKQWDQLPRNIQSELLTNQMTMQYLTRLQGSTPAQRDELLKGMSPAQKQKLEDDLQQWLKLPEERRQRMLTRYKDFLELNESEKAKIIRHFPDNERLAMENTLQAFQKLPPTQRAECITGFQKFSNLSATERQVFLKNAMRWQEMSPQDRQAWRELVRKTPEMPPLPPGLKVLPVPPGLKPASPLVASTNVAVQVH